MAHVIPERMCAQIDGDFVVFIIGLRVNRPWKVHKWLPVVLAMPRMLKELRGRPDRGLLGVESMGLTLVQYWRSFEAAAVRDRERTSGRRESRGADGLAVGHRLLTSQRIADRRGT